MGLSPGMPTLKVVQRPRRCHIFRAVLPLSLWILSPPCPTAQGLSYHQGEPSSQRQSRGGGGWAAWGMFCFSKAAFPARGGWGEVPRPSATTSSLGSPQPASESEYTGTMGTEGKKGGRRARLNKGPLSPTPGLSSFLQVRFFDPLKSPPRNLRTVSLGEGGLEGSCNNSTKDCGPTIYQMPQ